MTRLGEPASGPAALLTIPETARRLRCSVNHVYRLIASGKLRAADISAPSSRRPKTRVRAEDLAAYIDANTRTARRKREAGS